METGLLTDIETHLGYSKADSQEGEGVNQLSEKRCFSACVCEIWAEWDTEGLGFSGLFCQYLLTDSATSKTNRKKTHNAIQQGFDDGVDS